MAHTTRLLILAAAVVSLAHEANAQGLQAKIQARLPTIRALAADPAVVQAVKAANANPPAAYASMTQEKWAGLSVLDPAVRAFTRNEAAAAIKAKRTEEMTEVFVSSANGCKVAFLSKPTNWSHRGMPKHQVPMSGKTWEGQPETDESTGTMDVQVAVPVLDGAKPIGSIVVGLAVSKLR